MSKECTTHHFACDCREEKFKELERENAALRRLNYIGTCRAADGEKIAASIDLLKDGMAAFEKFKTKRGGAL